MNIKPRTGRRNYAKGGLVTGGYGLYDPEHPEFGAQGWSQAYQPAVGSSTFYTSATDKASRGSVGDSTYYTSAADKASRGSVGESTYYSAAADKAARGS